MVAVSECGAGATPPYQAQSYTAQLHHVGVGHGVQAAHPGVQHGDEGREDYCRVNVHVKDDA